MGIQSIGWLIVVVCRLRFFFFFSSRRRHTRFDCDWSSDVCSSDLRDQVEGLKHEPDALRPQARPAVLIELRQILPLEQHAPAGRHVESGQQRQQRRFTRTRGPGHRDRLARQDTERHLIDDGQQTFRTANLLAEVFRLEYAVADHRRLGAGLGVGVHRAPERGGLRPHHPRAGRQPERRTRNPAGAGLGCAARAATSGTRVRVPDRQRQRERRDHQRRPRAPAAGAAAAPARNRHPGAGRQRRAARVTGERDARESRAHRAPVAGGRRPGAAGRHAHSTELRAALHGTVRARVPGARKPISSATGPVPAGEGGPRSEAHAAGRHAPQRPGRATGSRYTLAVPEATPQEESSKRGSLMDRIWLKSYPPHVPAEVDPTRLRSLKLLLEETCARHAERVAFIQMGAQLTYRHLDELTRAFAAWLQQQGFGKGERLAIMLPNTLQYPIAMFGALRAGLIVVNTNPLYTAPELLHQLSDSGATAILVRSEERRVGKEC